MCEQLTPLISCIRFFCDQQQDGLITDGLKFMCIDSTAVVFHLQICASHVDMWWDCLISSESFFEFEFKRVSKSLSGFLGFCHIAFSK